MSGPYEQFPRTGVQVGPPRGAFLLNQDRRATLHWVFANINLVEILSIMSAMGLTIAGGLSGFKIVAESEFSWKLPGSIAGAGIFFGLAAVYTHFVNLRPAMDQDDQTP